MKNIYRSKWSGHFYADSKNEFSVWKRPRGGGRWYSLPRTSVNPRVFDTTNIYTGLINLLPPDWEMSMKEKIMRAF